MSTAPRTAWMRHPNEETIHKFTEGKRTALCGQAKYSEELKAALCKITRCKNCADICEMFNKKRSLDLKRAYRNAAKRARLEKELALIAAAGKNVDPYKTGKRSKYEL